jgi:hypothetical protein
MNNKPTQIDYLNGLQQLERKIFPKEPLKKVERNIWKLRLNLIKDNWKYSIKPMILNYNPFDFKIRIDESGQKTTPFSRIKDLVLGVYYIIKSTFTYVPLGFK